MAVVANPPASASPSPGVVKRVVDFYHGVVAELRRVTWPDFAQVRQATIAIILFVLFLGLVITILDRILAAVLVQLIPSLIAGG